jgi:hypothetical protein
MLECPINPITNPNPVIVTRTRDKIYTRTQYCHVLEWLWRGLDCGMGLLTTYTHNSELQAITSPPLISSHHSTRWAFSSLLCLHQPFPGNGFQQWRFFSFTRSGPLFTYSHAESCPLLITSRHGSHRKHSSSIFAGLTLQQVYTPQHVILLYSEAIIKFLSVLI